MGSREAHAWPHRPSDRLVLARPGDRPALADRQYIGGGALASNGRVEERIARIQRALQIGPGFWIGHLFLGNVLLNIGQTDAALGSLRRAVELSSGSAWASGPLGNAPGVSGRTDEARRVLRRMQAKSRDVFIAPSRRWRLSTSRSERTGPRWRRSNGLTKSATSDSSSCRSATARPPFVPIRAS